MRNTLKTNTLESKFPLLAVENDCIVSKYADITIGYKVTLPEIFTISQSDYENIHSVLVKAIKILPKYSILHKQDWFITEKYKLENGNYEDPSDMDYEMHFAERPFLNHTCYLYITKTTRERSKSGSAFSSLCRNFIIPKEIQDKEAVRVFMESVEQFEKIVNDNDYLKIERLPQDDITGTSHKTGVIEKYFGLTQSDNSILKDMQLNPESMKIGDDFLCVHTFSDMDDLPNYVSTDIRYEKLSTDKSDSRISFATPVGLLLSCNHIYNQYIFIDDHTENLNRFEKQARNMQSLSRYSRANQINKEWIEEYLNIAHSQGLLSIRSHCNIMAWADNEEEIKTIKNLVGSNISIMGCRPRHNTIDVPTLFWAGIPGNSGDFPAEESYYTFLEQALCFFNMETNYRSSLSPFGIKMCDRISGKPIHLDISDEPMRKGIITNRNKFILGPSGSGKSFFTNHKVRQYWQQGTHVLLIDTGNSYEGLCNLIKSRTNGEDGIYITFTEDNPIEFNPFYTDDRVFDIEKRESIKTLIMTLWKRDNEQPTRSEEVALSNGLSLYIKKIQKGDTDPCFNTFYEFINTEYREILQNKKVREKEFDLDNFLNVLEPYYSDGEYGYLLNSKKNIDLLHKRFIVFELDNVKDHKILFPVITIIIMETFINKMRRLKSIRKMILIEEAWKAIAKEGMAEYIKYLFKTVRKYFGEAVVVTQDIDDIIASSIIKDTIINNSDCKILLDQRKYINKFDSIQELLGLTEKEKSQILSINLNNDPSRNYKEVWIGLGGKSSAVYATEVSMEEYLTYTTEETEKMEVLRIAEKLGGNYELAIKQLANEKRNQKNQ